MDNGNILESDRQIAASTGLDEKLVCMIRREMRNVSRYDVAQTRKTLDRPLVAELIRGRVTDEAIYLASAALSLGFVSRDIETENMRKLLTAAHIRTNPAVELIMSVINFIKVKNHHPYLFAYYALEFLGKETSSTNVLHLVRGLGSDTADAKIAEEVVDYCNSVKGLGEKVDYEPLENKEFEAVYEKFAKVIIEVYDTIADFTIKELAQVTKEKMPEGVPEQLHPYICAVVSLSLCGRDTDMISIEEFVDALGISPNDKMVRMAASLRFRNQLAYIVSLYYLLSIGLEGNLDNMLKVVAALDLPPDSLVANKVLAYYNARSASKLV